jgi:biopolymer transport protein TolR
MRNLRRPGRRIISTINVVPYIDVMLVLLVIFMITTPLMTQGVHVNLPKANARVIPVVKNDVPIVVSVNQQGRYFVNVSPTPTVPVTASQLVNLIAAEMAVAKQNNQSQAVFIKGDAHVGYGEVVRAMVLMQQAGAGQIGLLTKSLPKTTEQQNDL